MDHQLMPRYQMTCEGRIQIARMRELAGDHRPARSPIIGIPLVLADGARVCIKIRRDHFQAACALAESARYDAGANRLVLNGERSCWKLIPQTGYPLQEALEAWARAQRGRAVAKSASPGERAAKRIDHEIGVLQRKRDKIYASRPVNLICQVPREHGGDWARESESAWRASKRTRKALARVFTVPALAAIGKVMRPDWKVLYAAAAAVLGVEFIPEHDRHSRVTKLTRGPSLVVYAKHPEKYLARMSKPWRNCGEWDAAEEAELMREARQRYLEVMSLQRALEAQIENLREVKRAAIGEGLVAESTI